MKRWRATSARLTCALLALASVAAVPLKKADTKDIASTLKYFIKYGYTDPSELRKADKNGALTALENDVKKFQKFAGLNETGELDEATKKKLQEPRCGIKDNVGRRKISKTGRRKRYFLHGSRWRVKTLTYRIENGPTSAPQQKHVDDVLEDALNTWAREANINFRPAEDDEKAHIIIKFASGHHGDGDPFDGRGGTLAHAYFPIYGGDAHFDDAEPWSINSRMGSNLYVASTHEFGHSLGLSHSDIRSMMSPWYQRPADPFSRNLLADDDKRAIRQLYGSRRSEDPGPRKKDPGPEIRPNTTPTYSGGRRGGGGRGGARPSIWSILGGGGYTPRRQTPVQPPRRYYPRRRNYFPFSFNGFIKDGKDEQAKTKAGGDDQLCANGTIDAALSVGNDTFVFRGQQYWRLTDEGVATGYPRPITQGWRNVSGPLDAAVHMPSNQRIYMFKGDQVFALSSSYEPVEGFPKPISAEFPGTTSGPVSATFVWKDWLYLVHDDKYWIVGYSSNSRSLADTPGMPTSIDAATRYGNGVTYIFEGQRYYRLDAREFKVYDEDKVPYPRNTGLFWFGCPSGT